MSMAGDPRNGGGLRAEVVTLRVSGVVIATILTGFALWALRGILEPFVLAVFLLIMVDGAVKGMRRRAPSIPRWASLAGALILIAAVFVIAVWVAADNAADMAKASHAYADRINSLLEEGAKRLGLSVTPTAASLVHRLNPGRFAGGLARGAGRFVEAAVFVLIYLGFLVASRQGFAAKMQALFQKKGEQTEASRIFERVSEGVERYIWVQTVVGVLITGLSAALMAATGLTHIPFWCLIIFLANYIPAIGAAVGVLFPAMFGLVEFADLWRAVVLVCGLEAIHFAVSHVVQPRMQGRSLNVDPIVVLLALAFWGLVWGVVGAFLSTPLTVVAMALLAEFPGGRPLAILLSSDGKPYADLNTGAARAPAATPEAVR
jgi:predicted PurR-regulated permease PerM